MIRGQTARGKDGVIEGKKGRKVTEFQSDRVTKLQRVARDAQSVRVARENRPCGNS